MSLFGRTFPRVSALVLVSWFLPAISYQAQQSQTPAAHQIRVRTGEVVVDPATVLNQATLQFLKDGSPDLKLDRTLPPPDARGRIQYVTRIGLDQFKPGKYELRVTVENGTAVASGSALFRVDP